MDDITGGYESESPTDASPASPDTQPAEAANNTDQSQGQAPADQTPFHQHPRFRELAYQNRQLRQSVAQLQRAMSQAQRQAPQPGQGPVSQEVSEAGQALMKVIREYPELRHLAELKPLLQMIPQMQQSYREMQARGEKMIIHSGQQHLAQLVKQAGLPSTPVSLKIIEDHCGALIKSDPEMAERFRAGDLSVVPEAFEQIKREFFSDFPRAQNQALADVKAQTRRLPPAPRGSAIPGPSVAPTVDPNDPQAFRKGLDALGQRTREMLARLTAQG